MIKRFSLSVLCLLSALAVQAANISFVLSNSINGTSDTNWFLLSPVSTPLANGQFLLTGVPERVYPGTGIILTNLSPGNYCASNKFLATSFASPYGSGTPLGVFFAVPNDPSTNVYSFCGPGILISGANTYNYTPGVARIVGTNGVQVYPGNAPNVAVVDGLLISVTNSTSLPVWSSIGGFVYPSGSWSTNNGWIGVNDVIFPAGTNYWVPPDYIPYPGPPNITPPFVAFIVVDSNGRQWQYIANGWR